jgi:hypothetical protein
VIVPRRYVALGLWSAWLATGCSTALRGDSVAPTTAAPPSAAAAPTSSTSTTIPPVSLPPTPESAAAFAPPVLAAPTKVLLFGDSLAYDESPAIVAAFNAAGLDVVDEAAPGVGLLNQNGDGLAFFTERVDAHQPNLVVYQMSLWDTGTLLEQIDAYQRFSDYVTQRGASLVLVTPPVVSEQQYVPTIDQLGQVAREIALRHPTSVRVLDIDEALGSVFVSDSDGDGVPERKPDGVHFCPSGAAKVAAWLSDRLTTVADGVQVAPTDAWAAGEWTLDERYPPEMCPLNAPLG